MDSLTQVVLGAAVGEAVLGRKEGNKALLWGTVGGTIPDLDVFFAPLFSDVQAVFVHRGFSHSILFALLLAPILGFLIYKFYGHGKAGIKGWTLLFFAAIVTHPLLDMFTNYGTGLFEPFSDYRLSFNTIFVVDPVYTLPMMAACIAVLFYNRENPFRSKLNWLGIALSSLYLTFTVFNKFHVNDIVEENLKGSQIAYEKYMTVPAPLTNMMWSVVVKQEDNYKVGYYSLFDENKAIDFKDIPKNEHLLEGISSNEKIADLIRFSKGYYALQTNDKGTVFNDLRFGTMTGWFDLSKDFIFSFLIRKVEGDVSIAKIDPEYAPSKSDLARLFKRISGDKSLFYSERN